MAFPFRLTGKHGPTGHRRLSMLEEIARFGETTMSSWDGEDQEDLRWLWRNDLLVAESPRPGVALTFVVSIAGKEALTKADDARAKAREKMKEVS